MVSIKTISDDRGARHVMFASDCSSMDQARAVRDSLGTNVGSCQLSRNHGLNSEKEKSHSTARACSCSGVDRLEELACLEPNCLDSGLLILMVNASLASPDPRTWSIFRVEQLRSARFAFETDNERRGPGRRS